MGIEKLPVSPWMVTTPAQLCNRQRHFSTGESVKVAKKGKGNKPQIEVKFKWDLYLWGEK